MKHSSARVLILNYEFPPLGGGAANALYYILRELAQASDLYYDLVTTSPNGREEVTEIGEKVTIHKVAVRKAGPHYWTEREILSYTLKGSAYAGRLMKNRDFALCHAFFALPCGWMAYRRRLRLPYIVSLRGSDVPGFNDRLTALDFILKPAFRRVLGGAAAVQANSEGLRAMALETSPATPIEVIHNGVDCRQFSPAPVKSRRDVHRLISVCRLVGRKGVADLIMALPRIKAALGAVELTLVGEGNLKASLERLAEANGVGDDIDWRGYVDHDRLPGLYAQADLFILPSRSEGMSNALLEAMAAGLPVVVTKTGGTEELINGNGLVVGAGEPAGLAQAVIQVLSDQSKRRAYAARSREIANRYSWENVAAKYLEVYDKVMGLEVRPKNPRAGHNQEKRPKAPDARQTNTEARERMRDYVTEPRRRITQQTGFSAASPEGARERYIVTHTRNLSDKTSYLHSDHSLVPELLDLIESSLAPGAKVLEVGCGGGHAAAAMDRLGFSVTATDISPVAVESAGKNYPGLDFQPADARELRFSNEAFDAVVAVELIEHLPEPETHIKEVYRVLGATGVYFVKTPNRYLHNVYYLGNREAKVWHPSVMSPAELRKKLRAAGFKVSFLKMKRLPDYQIRKVEAKLGPVGRLVKPLIARAPINWLPIWLQPSLICVAVKESG